MSTVTYFSLFINSRGYALTSFASISVPCPSIYGLNSSVLQKNVSVAHEKTLLVENTAEVEKIVKLILGKIGLFLFLRKRRSRAEKNWNLNFRLETKEYLKNNWFRVQGGELIGTEFSCIQLQSLPQARFPSHVSHDRAQTPHLSMPLSTTGNQYLSGCLLTSPG